MDIDAVITYVNALDPQWQADFMTLNAGEPLQKRYRDWGTLKYLLRGIRKFMPFVRNVYLVVCGQGQVPSWVNREKLKVVLHSQFIPSEFLPTFNSTAIEMFLHNIPGLAQRYIYFNDDFFPVAPMQQSDFFIGDKAVTGYGNCLFATGLYRKQCRNSDHLARYAAQAAPCICFKRPQHTCAAMIRPLCEEVSRICLQEIRTSITPLRSVQNLNQYLFTDYALFKGRTIIRRLPTKHISMAANSPRELKQFLRRPTTAVVCINDVQMSRKRYEEFSRVILDGFECLLPEPCEFEI